MKYKMLKKYYGYTSFKPEQEKIIDSIMSGKNTLGILPTGFGKSVTFQIPALLLDGLTIVITPLIALMQDQVMSLNKRGIPARYINSLQSVVEHNSVYNELLKGEIKLLYVSAERLESKWFLQNISRVKVALLVVDEAHTLLWSEDFRIALGHIPIFIKSLGYKVRILALTATATETTIKKINKLLGINKPELVMGKADRENIFYRVIKTTNKDSELITYIRHNMTVKGIIYCLTIKGCRHVYKLLTKEGFNASIYYGNMASDVKIKTQEDYTSGRTNIMICTNSFGMGIDQPDIRYVLLYDIPSSIEDYSQQTGRASRDGAYAEAILLFDIKDIKTVQYFIENINNPELTSRELKRVKDDRYIKLDGVVRMCYHRRCIHQYVSNYFGVEAEDSCHGMCMNCRRKK